jgi:hypothetical protein
MQFFLTILSSVTVPVDLFSIQVRRHPRQILVFYTACIRTKVPTPVAKSPPKQSNPHARMLSLLFSIHANHSRLAPKPGTCCVPVQYTVRLRTRGFVVWISRKRQSQPYVTAVPRKSQAKGLGCIAGCAHIAAFSNLPNPAVNARCPIMATGRRYFCISGPTEQRRIKTPSSPPSDYAFRALIGALKQTHGLASLSGGLPD